MPKNLNLNLHPAILDESSGNQVLSAKKLNSTIGVSHQENFTDTINQPYGPNRDPTGLKTKEFSETDYQNRNSSANKGVKRTDAISRRKNMQLVLAKNSENKPNASIAIDGNAIGAGVDPIVAMFTD